MAIIYDTRKIRTLLTEGFSADDLRRFCYDHSGFRHVYHKLPENPGKTQIIDALIEHAEQTIKIPELLEWAKEQNPARYEEHQLYIISTPQKPQAQTKQIPIPPPDPKTTDELHITVGSTIQLVERKIDLTHELRLLKAALLYADRVMLYSITSSMLLTEVTV